MVITDRGDDERVHHGAGFGRQHVRAVLEPTRDLYRARGVRHDIRSRSAGQRNAGAGVHPAPEHAERAEHVHTQPGPRRPAGDHHVRAVHVHHVHGRVVAVRRTHMQTQRSHQGRVHRCVRVHAHRPERREVNSSEKSNRPNKISSRLRRRSSVNQPGVVVGCPEIVQEPKMTRKHRWRPT